MSFWRPRWSFKKRLAFAVPGTVLVWFATTEGERLKKHCAQGDGKSCYQLAQKLADSGRRDSPEVSAALEDSCNKGYAKGCLAWGVGLLEVHPPARDQALKAFERACKAQFPGACARQGEALLTPDAAPEVFEKAALLLQKNCNATDREGCATLSQLRIAGLGVPTEIDRGLRELRAQCGDARDPQACVALYTVYSEGRFIPKDEAAARRFKQQACDLGRTSSCK